MKEKKGDNGTPSYVLGIASIVLAFFEPVAGIIFGIIAIVLGNKNKSKMGERGKKLGIIGLIIGIIILLILILALGLWGAGTLQNFPIE